MTTASLPDLALAPETGRPRRNFARFNALSALLLLVAGGLVTSTDSGLAVPDWPLSYGQWLPNMVDRVFFEHGHRMVAAVIGFQILVMAFWTQYADSRPGVRRLAWWTLFAVSVQGLLGGITVWFGLPYAISAAHATLGQTVFCLLVIMADVVGDEADALRGAPKARGLRWIGALAVGVLWTQLVLGSILRHGGSGIGWHIIGAGASTLAALWLACETLIDRREPELRSAATALLALLGLQLALGAATAAFRLTPLPRASYPMIATATIHLAVGAFLLGTATLLTFRLFRLTEKN